MRRSIRLTYNEYIDRYALRLYDRDRIVIGNSRKAVRDGVIPFIKSHKERFIRELEIKQFAGRADIYGLKELDQMIMYREECDDEVVLHEINRRIYALSKKYPRATAYLKAKKWAWSEDSFVSIWGYTATKRIVSGENYVDVIAEIGEKISEHEKMIANQ